MRTEINGAVEEVKNKISDLDIDSTQIDTTTNG
jgi:hypothetical protein